MRLSGMTDRTPWAGVLLLGSALSALGANHPLDHWQSRNTGANNQITALTYDSEAGRYIAVDEVFPNLNHQSAEPSALLASTDGINWVRQVTGSNQLETSAIAIRAGQYFSAKYSTYSAPIGHLMISTNGSDWTGDPNSNVHVKSAEVVDGKVVLSGVVRSGDPDACVFWLDHPCVRDPGTLAIWISGQDGVALSVPPPGYYPNDVLYVVDADVARGNGTWVYLVWVYWANPFPTFPSPPPGPEPMQVLAWSSRDGVNFLPGPDLQSGDPITGNASGLFPQATPGTSVVFGEGQFVAVIGTDRVFTSYDGIAWQSHLISVESGLQDIAYGAGQFVAVGTGGAIVTSSDGVHWTQRAAGGFEGTIFRDVEYGNYSFVATGFDSTGANVVIQSGTIVNLRLAMSPGPTLVLNAPALSRVRVEATSNPSDANSWTSVASVTMEADPYHWVDPQPSSASRFYRAVVTE